MSAEILNHVYSRSDMDKTGKIITVMVKEIPNTVQGRREVRFMSELSHRNIIPLLSSRKKSDSDGFEISMPYIESTLLDMVDETEKGMSEINCRHYFRQMLSVVEYMHGRGVVHRDLKLENIVVDVAMKHLYLIDFGFSEEFKQGRPEPVVRLGSIHYAAPEVVNRDLYDLPSTDVWSMGVCLFIMATGTFPFFGETIYDVMDDIDEGLIIPDGVSPALRDLLFRMLNSDPAKRITIPEIVNHSWMQKCQSLKGRLGMRNLLWRRGSH